MTWKWRILKLYGTGVWNADSLGNHRVVVSVDQPSDAVLALIQWRRKDFAYVIEELITEKADMSILC